MEPRIIKDVVISTETFYQQYDKDEKAYMFSYRIRIENLGTETLQLMTRYWEISDGLNWRREVSGEGVIGEQPILHPAEIYSYDSWCPSPSLITYMKGYYIFRNTRTEEMIKAEVPQMNFIVPDVLN